MSETDRITEAELAAYHGDTLPSAARADLAARIATDPKARATLEAWRAQDAAIAALYGPAVGGPVPDRLLGVLREARDRGAPPRRAARALAAVALVGALLLLGGAGGWALARLTPPAMMQASLADTALRAHATYVVEVVHPVEVRAEEAAHLTGWLSKRLGRPLSPPDFSAEGFRLMGGRVVPSGAGPAALLMYEDDLGRRVTLFAAPGKAGGDTAFQFAQSDRAQSFTWVDGALSYAVSGDIPRDMLRTLALSAYDQLI